MRSQSLHVNPLASREKKKSKLMSLYLKAPFPIISKISRIEKN